MGELNTEVLEETVLQIADGNTAATARLRELLEPFATVPLPDDASKILEENASLIIPDVDALPSTDDGREFLFVLADADVGAMPVRDALAACARRLHADYADPAGLIRALGVLDEQTPVRTVRQRLAAFGLLREGALVWHPSFGAGRVVEVDEFSGLVDVTFSSRQQFDLEQALASLAIANNGSFATELADRQDRYSPSESAADVDQKVADSFIPRLSQPDLVVSGLVMPRLMSKKAYDDWRYGTANAKGASKTSETAPAVRTWETARSLEELRIHLAEVSELTGAADHAGHFLRLFRFEANKPAARYDFGQCLSMLWKWCGKESWLIELTHQLPDDTVSWSSIEAFNDINRKLSAKQIPGWFGCSLAARGREWFVSTLTELPLRFWTAGEAVLTADDDSADDLEKLAFTKSRKGTGNADCVLWLWRNRRESAAAAFSNPTALFRILGRTVKGEYLKAHRDLHKLLMDNQDFQRAAMNQGEGQGIANLVKAVKNTNVLNKGEQQSLLVKIVRVFPEAQSLVEERKQVIQRRAMPKMTSFRSMEERRAELLEIINTLIPKNSAQIQLARSYGDLRENAEFKAAKERQRLLMARRGELESGLNEVMPTDFSDVTIERSVIPGCTVTIEVDGGEQETYHILGLWDSVPERRILSYDTPMGKVLLNQSVGDTITTPQSKTARIVSVEPLSEELRQWVQAPE